MGFFLCENPYDKSGQKLSHICKNRKIPARAKTNEINMFQENEEVVKPGNSGFVISRSGVPRASSKDFKGLAAGPHPWALAE
jgi:hypothetical protein